MSDWSTEQDLKGNLMGEIEKRSCARKIKNLKVFFFFSCSVDTVAFRRRLFVCWFVWFLLLQSTSRGQGRETGHQEVYQRELHFLQVTYYITLKDGDGEAGGHTHTRVRFYFSPNACSKIF